MYDTKPLEYGINFGGLVNVGAADVEIFSVSG